MSGGRYVRRRGSARGRVVRFAAMLAVVGAALVTACSQHTPMGPEGSGGTVVEIELRNFEFSNPDLTISPGTTVRWINTTDNYHTVTPDGHDAWTAWETTVNGEAFEVTFDETGVFPYYCMPHRALGMTGVVTVE